MKLTQIPGISFNREALGAPLRLAQMAKNFIRIRVPGRSFNPMGLAGWKLDLTIHLLDTWFYIFLPLFL